MSDEERRVLEHLKALKTLQDDEFERVVILEPDHMIAAALGIPVQDVTAALIALSARGVIIAEGNANYGPIVAIYLAAA